MKSAAAFVVLACLLMVHVQGQARPSVKRCLCQGSGVNVVRLQRVEKVEVYPAGPSCENVEIIVTLKNGAGQKCLNPESSFAQNYIKRAFKKSESAVKPVTQQQ
ncbi:C-X-C motif chemokine 11-6-like [Colossoma macropomum]|uniref:C-X-C motif chemokine 11-6-like n=1 Tax=Colossoma macropomum TaxID=42526 RepID=UPI001864B750|nr:C-X-C motif chemokine 11-6-like [Colossoma macropomum]